MRFFEPNSLRLTATKVGGSLQDHSALFQTAPLPWRAKARRHSRNRRLESSHCGLLIPGAALSNYLSQLVMLHLLNVREVGLHERKETLEVGLLAKALQVPLLRNPLDA